MEQPIEGTDFLITILQIPFSQIWGEECHRTQRQPGLVYVIEGFSLLAA
jgi:hypothetical protein